MEIHLYSSKNVEEIIDKGFDYITTLSEGDKYTHFEVCSGLAHLMAVYLTYVESQNPGIASRAWEAMQLQIADTMKEMIRKQRVYNIEGMTPELKEEILKDLDPDQEK